MKAPLHCAVQMGCLSRRPARCGFFYGWAIVAVTVPTQMCAHIGSVLVNSLTLARIYDDMETRLGVARTVVASYWMFGTLLSAVAVPVLGVALDRWGGRVCMPICCVAMGLSMLLLDIAGADASTAQLLILGFFVMRASGMGALTPACTTVINQWFERRRGLALSINQFTSMFLTCVQSCCSSPSPPPFPSSFCQSFI